MTLLRVEGIGKDYGDVVALQGIDLDVPAGSRTAIVGPSGSGKTTLLRIIAGFEAPDTGRLTLDQQVMADGRSMVPAHRRGIGVVTQDGALFPHLSVAGNIGFGLERGEPHREARIRALMETVELSATMVDRRPHQLSGGQQQRVALARALARQPKLMLLDEPFSALDTGLRETMRKAVAAVLRGAGITTILVTHDQGEALSFADQVAILRDGRLVQVGSPQDLYLRPNDRDTAAFLGDTIMLSAELEGEQARCVLGSLPIDDTERRGPADIMLRPEQIRLSPMSIEQAGIGPVTCRAKVTDVEFGGATCTITVAIDGDPVARPLRIRSTGIDLPAVGTAVGLTVIGKAHVFA